MERRYAMTKLGSGDYLLPSNDGRTLWRVCRYEEDGSGEVSADGKTWTRVVGTYWQIARRPMPSPGTPIDDDFLFDGWTWWAHMLPTRKAAIEEALAVTNSR